MLSQIKGYLFAIGGVIVAVFVAMFKYRGKKIDALKKDVETERKNAEAHEDQVKKTIADLELRGKYNEIDKNIIKSDSDTNRDRLSKFNRD